MFVEHVLFILYIIGGNQLQNFFYIKSSSERITSLRSAFITN